MSSSRIFLAALILLGFGCSKKSAGTPPRYAFLRFENLSGDPSLDWVARAASEVLPVSLDGALDGPVLGSASVNRATAMLGPHPVGSPGISGERSAAILAGATRTVSGYVERIGSALRIVATEQDVASGGTVRLVSAEDASPVRAIDKLAHEFSSSAKPYLTANSTALHFYSAALEAQPPARGEALRRAAEADPAFGPAWVSLIGYDFSRGDSASAARSVATARAQKLDPLSRANLEYEAANLTSDRGTRLAALKRISELSPADTVLMRNLAEAEQAAGDFSGAASDWKRVTAANPADPQAWNSLGYARSWAGDYQGGLAALREYERLRPNDPNPLDSIGDLNYAWQKFDLAAASYLQANAKDPAFEDSGEFYKAAWAKYQAGDKPGADKLFAQFRAVRQKNQDALLDLISADWLYRTARKTEAVDLLRHYIAAAVNPSLRANALNQLAVWELIAGYRARAATDAAAAGNPGSAPAVIIRFATLPSASAAEWHARAEKMIPGPGAASLRQIALGYALLLDGKRSDAVPVWQEVVASATSADFVSREILARLQRKAPVPALVPDPKSLNQLSAVLDMLAS